MHNRIEKFLITFWALFLSNIALNVCESCNYTSASQSPAKQLLKNLFCDYDKRIRPTTDPNKVTEVSVQFNPFYIFIDGEWDAVHIAGHAEMIWTDDFLKWNEKTYKQTSIRGKYLNVWVPEIVSFDEGVKGFFESEDSFVEKYVTVSSSGKVTLYSRILLTGHCDIEMHYWPYMKANCTVLAGYPNYDSGVKYNYKSNLDLQYLRKDGVWNLESIVADCDWYQSDINSDKVCILTYKIGMATYVQLYSSPVILPSVVLSILTLLPFWMKYNSIHRLIIALFTFFGQLVYLVMLSVHLEDSISESIMIVDFFKNSMLFSTISIIATILVRSMLLKKNLPPKVLVDLIRFFPSTMPFKILWIIFVGNDSSELTIHVNEDISAVGKLKTVVQEWKILANILDRTLFFILFLFTVIFWIKLMP